jgi:hypothetical protein
MGRDGVRDAAAVGATSEKRVTAIESMRSCECGGGCVGRLAFAAASQRAAAGLGNLQSLALRLAAHFRSQVCK